MGILCKTLGYVVDFKCKTWHKQEVLANDKKKGKTIIENSQINQMLKFREVLKWLLQNKAVGHKNGGGDDG